MSTKAYYPINEIGAGKPGFSKTRSIIADGAPNDLQKNSPNPWVRQFFNAQPDAE